MLKQWTVGLALLGCVTTAGAQDPVAALGNLTGNLNNTVNGLLLGDASQTAVNLGTTTTTLIGDLSNGVSGADSLSGSGIALTNTLVNASLAVTPLADDLAGPLAAAGAPITGPAIEQSDALLGNIQGLLDTLAALSGGGLPGADALPALPGLEGGTGGLPLDGLPIPVDALDPATLTGLLGGGTLPGLGDSGAPALPVEALDPATLTGLLDGGVPALPGAGGLPLDALDPALVTGLLGGGLPALPGGAGGLPVDALDPATLTGLLGGGLPVGAGDLPLPLDAVDPATVTGPINDAGLPES